MYNTNTASVNLKVTALTSDTLYRLAELLTGNRYASLQFTADECEAIEMNAYAANMGASDNESAWVRFCELCTADKAISDTVKDRLGMADSGFEVGAIVKYRKEWCSEGEEAYRHIILEQRLNPITEKPTRYLIRTLNTKLVLAPTETVDECMIERA